MVMMLKMVMVQKKMNGTLSCGGNKYIFCSQLHWFQTWQYFPQWNYAWKCEIKDCSLNAVELRDSYNTESLKMLFYTTAAYGRWTKFEFKRHGMETTGVKRLHHTYCFVAGEFMTWQNLRRDVPDGLYVGKQVNIRLCRETSEYSTNHMNVLPFDEKMLEISSNLDLKSFSLGPWSYLVGSSKGNLVYLFSGAWSNCDHELITSIWHI